MAYSGVFITGVVAIIITISALIIFKREGFEADYRADDPMRLHHPDTITEEELKAAEELADVVDVPEHASNNFTYGNTVYIDTLQGTQKVPNMQIRQDPPVTIHGQTMLFHDSVIPNYVQEKAA